jgi:TRAP-type mannitol/chloroaromatic compound transport system substrate-binding protein
MFPNLKGGTMKRNRLIALFLAVPVCLMLLLPSVSPAAEKPIKWRMQVLWDPGTLPYKIEEQFADRVRELTNGRLDIKIYAPGSLVPTAQMLDSLQAGMIDMMKQYEGYYIGKMPEVAFTSALPLGFTDTWQFETWFWQLGGIELLRDSYAQQGCYYIAPTIYGQEPIHSKFPVKSIADFKGKKGRFVGLAGPVMAKLGASVTPLPTAEVYSALEKGVIDFADRGGLAANYDAGLYEVAKYIILPGFHQPTTATCYVANMNSWNKLPKDIQAIVETAAREASAELFQQHLVKGAEALEKFKEKGCEVIYLPESDIKQIRKTAMEVWAEYGAKSEKAQKILDSQEEWMKQIGLID